jgi:phenylacetate-coenzyme A ligase PaaK-like adenylate-forming protein
MSDFHLEVYKLVTGLEENQYKERDVSLLIPNIGILTREELQKIPVDQSKPFSSTSGATGQPVFVQKYMAQHIWYWATNMRELIWRKWDTSLNLAVINAPVTEEKITPWPTNPYLFTKGVGKCYMHPTRGDLQSWLDRVQPDYLHTYPSIIATLDTSKLKDVKSTSEMGGTNYSSEEVGTIGLECPNNPDVYHIMENIVLEIVDDNDIVVTDLTHPYIKRYKIGDKGEFATCSCGRKLQTINRNVLGRIRNMIKYQDGTTAWPLFGSNTIRNACDTIKRFQCVQESYTDITLKVQGTIPEDKIEDVKKLVLKRLNHPFNLKIEFVESFPEGKFEEFVCKI